MSGACPCTLHAHAPCMLVGWDVPQLRTVDVLLLRCESCSLGGGELLHGLRESACGAMHEHGFPQLLHDQPQRKEHPQMHNHLQLGRSDALEKHSPKSTGASSV